MSPTAITTALSRHGLAEVARRSGIVLPKDTGTVTVRCPLPSHGHPDRTPSMRLYLDDGHYFCFGCGAKGDVIQWVRDAEQTTVSEAIRLLESSQPLTNTWQGDQPGVRAHPRATQSNLTQKTGPEPPSQAETPDLARTPPPRVFAALQAAWGYYSYHPLNQRGAAYLTNRGIEVGVLEAHTGRLEVGHTPAKADGLVSALRVKGFSDDELVDAGLGYRRLGSEMVSDFFRQRVLVPLRNHNGQVCGFIGRNIGDTRWPKYKNPPHTHAYDKSVNLYQPLPVPTDRRGQVVVVEGTLDALAIAVAAVQAGRAGSFCPVTQSGRELSDAQMHHILALHPSVPVLAFDADRAGLDSAARYALGFARYGKAVAVAVLDADHDPASWLADQGVLGLSAWSRDGPLVHDWNGPIPAPAAIIAASYTATREGSRTRRMDTLADIARVSSHLSGRARQLWAERVATVAGPIAVAEAHEHVVSHPRTAPSAEPAALSLADWQPEPSPQIALGFESVVGPGGMEDFIQRVAMWGRRLPRAGDPSFVRAASVAIDKGAILSRSDAEARLDRVIERTGCSIERPEAATPLLTSDPVVV